MHSIPKQKQTKQENKGLSGTQIPNEDILLEKELTIYPNWSKWTQKPGWLRR